MRSPSDQIDRRRFIQGGSAALGAALGASLLGSSCADRPPWNVLFIVVDDLNNWVGCLGGHPDARTPNIDQLAAEGQLFTRAYSVSTTCNSSRSSVMTGLSPTTTRIFNNRNPSIRESLGDIVTLPEDFARNGYRTAGGGKTFHAYDASAWQEHYVPPQDEEAEEQRVRTEEYGMNRDRKRVMLDWGPLKLPANRLWDGLLSKWGVRQLEREDPRPFFLGLGFFRPHLPWLVPARFFRPFPYERMRLPEILRGTPVTYRSTVASGDFRETIG